MLFGAAKEAAKLSHFKFVGVCHPAFCSCKGGSVHGKIEHFNTWWFGYFKAALCSLGLGFHFFPSLSFFSPLSFGLSPTLSASDRSILVNFYKYLGRIWTEREDWWFLFVWSELWLVCCRVRSRLSQIEQPTFRNKVGLCEKVWNRLKNSMVV